MAEGPRSTGAHAAATRYELRRECSFWFNPEEVPIKSMGVSREILAAFLAGETRLLTRHADLYRERLAWKTAGAKIPDALTLGDTFAILVGLRYLGDAGPGARPLTSRSSSASGPMPRGAARSCTSAPRRSPKETWPSFDAVEIRGDELVAYHYMGCRYKAPLLFKEGLDSFSFLDGVDLRWKLVEERVSRATWESIERLRRAGRSRHVVVYDAAEAGPLEGHTEAAAEHHGVRLMTESFLVV